MAGIKGYDCMALLEFLSIAGKTALGAFFQSGNMVAEHVPSFAFAAWQQRRHRIFQKGMERL